MDSQNNNPTPASQGSIFLLNKDEDATCPKFPINKGEDATCPKSPLNKDEDATCPKSPLIKDEDATCPKFPLNKGGAAGGGGVVFPSFPNDSFPSPEQLKEYESVMPGLAQRLINQAEKQTNHRIDIETRLVTSGIRKSTLGLIFGFLIGTIGIGGGFYLTAIGYNVIGVIFSSATLVTMVSTFIYGSQSKKNELKKQ